MPLAVLFLISTRKTFPIAMPWGSCVSTTYPFAKHPRCSTRTQKAKPKCGTCECYFLNWRKLKGLRKSLWISHVPFSPKAAGETRIPLLTASLKNQSSPTTHRNTVFNFFPTFSEQARVWRHVPVIPAFGRQRQGNHEPKTSRHKPGLHGEIDSKWPLPASES